MARKFEHIVAAVAVETKFALIDDCSIIIQAEHAAVCQMSALGPKPTCIERLKMSACWVRADIKARRRHFGFWTRRRHPAAPTQVKDFREGG